MCQHRAPSPIDRRLCKCTRIIYLAAALVPNRTREHEHDREAFRTPRTRGIWPNRMPELQQRRLLRHKLLRSPAISVMCCGDCLAAV